MIYFDNASTTQVSERSFALMKKYACEQYFNPSTGYHEGIAVKEAVNSARKAILNALRGDGKLIFTSGGTEGDDTALFCTKKPNKSRIIVSNGEHAAVYYSALELKSKGYDVVFCPVDGKGAVMESEFIKLLSPDTSLISVMHVSNETGAINDIAKLVALAKAVNPNVIFHSDGVQAAGKIKVNLRALNVDLYTVSGHKLHAPKGTGALYIKNGVNISPYIIGGGQEGGLRSSTENVPAIAAFGDALPLAIDTLSERTATVANIKNVIKEGLSEINGLKPISDDNGSPFIYTFTSDCVRGEVMQHALERQGILIGTGSACASNKAGKRIPTALGLDGKFADGIVRLSFSAWNTVDEAREFLNSFKKTYTELSKYGN